MENVKSSETPELTGLISKYSPYLFEIRKRVFFTLIVFAAATIFGFVFYEKIIKFMINLLQLEGINIVFTSPFQFINLAISCGIASGVVLTFPLLIYQIFSFLRPALREKEFKMLTGFLPFSIILFLLGFSFGFLTMKWQIQLFLTKSVSLGIGNVLDISRLISTVIAVSVLMGLAFQFPIIILFLLRIGIIKHNQLSKTRMWVYLGSFIFAILLPADSILADVLLSLPLIVLFELTLILNRILERKTA
ncbi:twin arginine-targeting protein translocase TatC [Candidatus Daviesbacteria bacterium RIFOXYD1_FULL_41_10]|uniref:Sec-independent protein translocase protein TatC n=2 Tax=Candidatus Daviesiibacteriota TaxID=1752718 RepID=A0A1F5MZW7_9BACT|nr:MAG: Twin arginine-targeting protein translocase TatC [Candidatus Daviesbacteria bacterium GW2011_GWB1_41_5]OGE70891.1 MAG: twin arginine-targeting protein translocase TatC [Candidatus Daviesbacteria bacterium RIFOXYD1_FULL_41_10]